MLETPPSAATPPIQYLSGGQFAEILDAQRAEIIRIFIDRSRAEVPGARGHGKGFIKDHLPDVLKAFAQYLRQDVQDVFDHSAWLSDNHGLQRAAGETYTVDDLRREYYLLDKLIKAHLPAKTELSAQAYQRYGEVFGAALSHATETFVRNSVSELIGHKVTQILVEGERDTARTERDTARTERDLSHGSQAWFSAAINRIPKAIFFLNRETQTMWFSNDAAKKILGLTYETERDQAIHDGRIVVSTPAGQPLPADQLPSARAFRGETIKAEEFTLRTPAGYFYLRVSAEQLPASLGQPASAVMVLQDITELKATETDLRQKNAQLSAAERQLSAAIKVARIGFFDWDMQQDVFTISDQFAHDWGVKSGVTVGDLFELILPEDRALTQKLIDAAAESGQHYVAQYRIRRKTDNQVLWIEAQGRVTKDAAGKPHMFLGTSVDISERKSLESETIAMVNSIPQLAWMGDADAHLFWYNQGWQEFTGASQEEMKQLGWAPFHHPDHLEKASKKWFDHLEAGTPWEDVFPLKNKNGEYRIFLSRASPVKDLSGKILKWFGTNTDITDTVRANEELTEAKAAAESANRAKSQFLANMSHEIRTPLGAIMGFSDLLRSTSLPAEDMTDYINVIERNSKHLLRIVDDILDLSKVEAGMLVVEEIGFSLVELLSDFASLMGLRAREKGIQFNLRFESKIPDPVISDPTRLRQILNNLVSNAMKFTVKGQVELTVSFAEGLLNFRVSDTGIGMTDEQALRLFVPFQQADSTTTRKFGGTGLGLVLTRRLCEAMGGRFDLTETKVDRGTTFSASVRIRLPEDAVLVEAVITITGQPHGPTVVSDGHALDGFRILLVEDSPDNQVLITLLLAKEGAKVEIANDGVEGVSLALTQQFDVVLCDMQMPHKDGYETVRELRGRGYAVPIVALTAHAMKEEYAKAIAAGFSDYLTKPVQKLELINTVGKHASSFRSSQRHS